MLIRLLPLAILAGCSASSAPPKQSATPAPKPIAAKPPPPRKEGLKPKQISSVVMSRYGDVNGCHAVTFAGSSEAEGSMVVGWTITPDGSVNSPQVIESTFANADVERCVLQITAELRFPRATDATDVSWKFKFRANQKTH
jgi:outer membrane biosynthesis protein TonB